MPNKVLSACFLAVFTVLMLNNAPLSGGVFWDFLNGLGFAAFSGLIYVNIASPKVTSLSTHQKISYVAVVLIIAHALGFLIFDPLLIEYLKFGAPIYMWAGLLSLTLLLFLVITALNSNRLKAHASYAGFQQTHKLLSYGAIIACLYHIIASGFYLQSLWQAALFCIIALAILNPSKLHKLFTTKKQSPDATSTAAAVTLIGCAVLFATMFAGVKVLLAILSGAPT